MRPAAPPAVAEEKTSSSSSSAATASSSSNGGSQTARPHPVSAARSRFDGVGGGVGRGGGSGGGSGSLTSRRPKSRSHIVHRAPDDDEVQRSLAGLEVTVRSVIPTPPVRAQPFHLDHALANLESQLTGITPGTSGLTAPPVAHFPPTNFYIQWPPPPTQNDDQRRGGEYKNNWISPRDLLVEKTLRPKTTADFPAELTIHSQRHQPGLLGFQGDLPLSAVQALHPTEVIAGGAAAKHFTGRVMHETMRAATSDGFTGAKPKTTGERNAKIGPGSYGGVSAPAVLARSATSFKPAPPKSFEDRGLVQGPGAGSYTVRREAVEKRSPALHFGGTQKTHSRSSALANLTGALGTDPGGPGFYAVKEPLFGGEPTSVFLRAPRFPDPTGATGHSIGAAIVHAPGPGSYQLNGAAVGAIGAGRECVSFAARGGGGSAAAVAVNFKRAHGPAVGSYNPADGLDIGASSLVGHAVTTARPLHKFATSPRFDYHSRPHPLYALVITSAKQRSTELTRNFKPDLTLFQGHRKEQLLAASKAERKQRQAQAQTQRMHLRQAHLDQVDRILNADLYRQQEREASAAAEFLQFVRRGWLFYIALGARMQAMKENVRRVRTAKNLRLLTTNAARTIVLYARKWAQKAHAKKVARCARIVLRALRRNVVRASLRRKRRAVRLITILALNRANKTRALLALGRYRAHAVRIQRCVRDFLGRKRAALHLLGLQWQAAEMVLATKYKHQEGEKAYEKIRKKGLLIKNMTPEAQRAKICREIPFDLVEERLRERMIEEDYTLRVRQYQHAKYDWLRARRRALGQPEPMSLVDSALVARRHRESEIAARNVRAAENHALVAAVAASAAGTGTSTASGSPPATSSGMRERESTPGEYHNGRRPTSTAQSHRTLTPHPPTTPLLSASAQGGQAAAAAQQREAVQAALQTQRDLVQTHQQQANQPSSTALAWEALTAQAAAAVASGLAPYPSFDPAKPNAPPPRLPRLPSALRVYWLITAAQQRQAAAAAGQMDGGGSSGSPGGLDPELRKRYKKLIASILRALAARDAKEEKLRAEAERERDEARREAEAHAQAQAAAAANPPKPAAAGTKK